MIVNQENKPILKLCRFHDFKPKRNEFFLKQKIKLKSTSKGKKKRKRNKKISRTNVRTNEIEGRKLWKENYRSI